MFGWDPDECLWQGRCVFGFGVGLGKFRCCQLVLPHSDRKGTRRDMHTRCHVDRPQHIMPISEDQSNGCQKVSNLGRIKPATAQQNNTPSVPSERVPSFCSRASICDATAALKSRSSLRFSSSAFFSFTRATRAGDWPPAPGPREGCRMWDGKLRVG